MILKLYNTIKIGYKVYNTYCIISKALLVASYSFILYDMIFNSKK